MVPPNIDLKILEYYWLNLYQYITISSYGVIRVVSCGGFTCTLLIRLLLLLQSTHSQRQLEEIKTQKIRLEERLVQEQAAKDEMDEKYM